MQIYGVKRRMALYYIFIRAREERTFYAASQIYRANFSLQDDKNAI